MKHKMLAALILAAGLGTGMSVQAMQPMSDDDMSKVTAQNGTGFNLLGITIIISLGGSTGGDHDRK